MSLQSSEAGDIWRTPQQWAKVVAEASVIAGIKNKKVSKVGYSATTLAAMGLFKAAREKGEIPNGYRRVERQTFVYSRETQLKQMRETIAWIYRDLLTPERERWEKTAEELL